MNLGPDESLEDYEERLQLNYKRANCTLDPRSLKLLLILGIREEVIETLNMLSGGDIYQLPYGDINIVILSLGTTLEKLGRKVELAKA